MKNCAGELPGATRRPSTLWSTGIRRAPIGSPAPSSATRPTRVTCRSRRSSGSTNRPAASTAVRAFPPGSIGSWSTCASIINGATDGGARCSRCRIRPTTPARLQSIRLRPSAVPSSEAIRGQSLGLLRGALERLSPSQRTALLLQVQEGLSSREIAAGAEMFGEHRPGPRASGDPATQEGLEGRMR